MASQGPLSPGTMADDATVGTVAWTNSNFAKVSDNNHTFCSLSGTDGIVIENSVKIVKADGTIGTTDKSIGATLPTVDTYIPYGSSSDLWGETWTAEDINDVDFGVVFSATSNGTNAHYLKATNFGFSIPTGATINGILVEIEELGYVNVFNKAGIDHIRITVYYTEGATTTSTSSSSTSTSTSTSTSSSSSSTSSSSTTTAPISRRSTGDMVTPTLGGEMDKVALWGDVL